MNLSSLSEQDRHAVIAVLARHALRQPMPKPDTMSDAMIRAEAMVSAELAKASPEKRQHLLDDGLSLYSERVAQRVMDEVNGFTMDFIIDHLRNPSRIELDAHMRRLYPKQWKSLHAKPVVKLKPGVVYL